MEKKLVLVVIFLIPIFAAMAWGMSQYGRGLTGLFVGFHEPEPTYVWWNSTWKYRFRVEITSTSYDRTDWPVEYRVNFTDLLPEGTIDEASVRVIEYGPAGNVIQEVTSQLDKDQGWDGSANAEGTLSFFMDGITPADTTRIYYVYYDVLQDGTKAAPGYPVNFAYGWDGSGEEFNVNNTAYTFYVDTFRGESTSGLYRVRGMGSGVDIWPIIPNQQSRTYEYSQYSNGTTNFSFDLRNNATFKYVGPIRMVVEQRGSEKVWNTTTQTEGYITKRYTIYSGLNWIKVETNFTNTAGYAVVRNSTFAGAISIDASRIYGGTWQSAFGSSSDNWWFASDSLNNFQTGIIQLNHTGTNNYYLPNCSGKDRMGVQLNSTTVASGSSIIDQVALFFDYQSDYTVVRSLRDKLLTFMNITTVLPESRHVVISPFTSNTVYNRNETVLITGDVSAGDPFGLATDMNATFDMGTAPSGDDQTIVLHDDGSNGDAVAGDRIFSSYYDIPSSASLATWKANLTVYANGTQLLNTTVITFDVTNSINVGVLVLNKNPIGGTMVRGDVSVRNFRQDTWISGAGINCTYFGSTVLNVTDLGNGTYSINFTAPIQEQVHTIFCNASYAGNSGLGNDTFTSESTNTYIDTGAHPSSIDVSNVTLAGTDSFVVSINSSNHGNGTAYSANISLELLPGWTANSTFLQCGNILKDNYCIGGFKVTVPASTVPGSYYINATTTWTEPIGTQSENKTQLNVTVLSNPVLAVEESIVEGEMGDATSEMLVNFTLRSVGNDAITGSSFSCASGTACGDFQVGFLPSSVGSLNAGSNTSIAVNVTIPLGHLAGTYDGTVNASSANGGSDTFTLRIKESAKTNVSISSDVTSYEAGGVSLKNSESFYFDANATDVRNGSARSANISIVLPTGWYSNGSVVGCGDLTRWKSCVQGFNVTIPNATLTGNYNVKVFTNWTNPDLTLGFNSTTIVVTVSSNAIINLTLTNLTATIGDGTKAGVGNFTILSTGNVPVFTVTFACISGEACSNFTLGFSPTAIASMNPDTMQNVFVNVTVPVSYPSGTYHGQINVSSQNGNNAIVGLSVTVPDNRTWDAKPASCERSLQEKEGTVCDVNVTNRGNTYINFTVGPSVGNFTSLSETAFSVGRLGVHTFEVLYNTTGFPDDVYNSTFLIDAIEGDAIPSAFTLKTALVPYIPPIIKVAITPNETWQNTTVQLNVSITDRSNSGIGWVKANITWPNGSVEEHDMQLVSASGSVSNWTMTFPNTSTVRMVQRGSYNVTIAARDNIGNEGYNSSVTFLVYAKMGLIMSTMSNRYYQGDTGQVYFIVRNLTDDPLANVSVNFSITDPNGNSTYQTSDVPTDQNGVIMPLPSFTIFSDSPVGDYNLTAKARYYDAVANRSVENQTVFPFEVISRSVTVSGLFADIDTAVVWYPPLPGYDTPQIKFGILTYNAEGTPVDPTSMNLTLYRPDGFLYFSDTMANMQRQATGYYTYNKNMISDTPTGMYLAVINVTQGDFTTQRLKAFRVSRGGPYDISLTPLENEVQQGTPLDFIISADNKGEVSQDVLLDYWIESQGNTFYSKSEAVLTPGLTKSTFTRTAFIASDQPLGNYYLHLKVTYDNDQPPIFVNTSFIVVAKNMATTTIPAPIYVTYNYGPIPTGAAPTPTPTQKLQADLAIARYSSNVSLARGYSDIEIVTVNNTGDLDLSNVSISFSGLPQNWFSISPDYYRTTTIGNSSVFLITFNVPANANTGSYPCTLVATSGVVSDQKQVTVNIYESVEVLLRQEIMSMRDTLQSLLVDSKVAELEGKDVSGVKAVTDQAKTQLDQAETNLNTKNTDDAMGNLANAKNLLEKGRGILNVLLAQKAKAAEIPIYVWAVVAILIIVLGAAAYVLVSRRKQTMGPASRPWLTPLTKLVEDITSRGKSASPSAGSMVSEASVGERDRLLRMLEVLEREKNEHIISPGAYKEMKSSVEEKLRKIEGRMFGK